MTQDAFMSASELIAIRTGLGLTQSDFAKTYGFTKARIKDWEQGRSRIDLPSAVYLMAISRFPRSIRKIAVRVIQRNA